MLLLNSNTAAKSEASKFPCTIQNNLTIAAGELSTISTILGMLCRSDTIQHYSNYVSTLKERGMVCVCQTNLK